MENMEAKAQIVEIEGLPSRFSITTESPVAFCGDCKEPICEFFISADSSSSRIVEFECERCEQRLMIDIDALNGYYNKFRFFLKDKL